MAGKFLHGAFIQFSKAFLIPVPNVIVFQFNPETITHSWQPAQVPYQGEGHANPLAVTGTPGESFQLTLAMDASDMVADGSPIAEGIAKASGIYTRLAALEMLLFPEPPSAASQLVGAIGAGVGGSLSAGLTGAAPDVPLQQLPVVLWVWGPGRILPVKLTSLSITETLYDPLLLNPTHAEAQVGLQVLTIEDLGSVQGTLAAVAKIACKYSQGLRQTLAIANLANSVESIIGMLPV